MSVLFVESGTGYLEVLEEPVAVVICAAKLSLLLSPAVNIINQNSFSRQLQISLIKIDMALRVLNGSKFTADSKVA